MVDGGEMIAAVGFLVRRADANWEGRVGVRLCVPNAPWDNLSADPIIDTMNEAGQVRCDRHHWVKNN